MDSQTKFRVSVLGTTWGGYTSAYECTFDQEPSDAVIKRKAGDFQSIEDYRIVKVIHSGDWNQSQTTRTVIHDWKHADSEATYFDCQGAS